MKKLTLTLASVCVFVMMTTLAFGAEYNYVGSDSDDDVNNDGNGYIYASLDVDFFYRPAGWFEYETNKWSYEEDGTWGYRPTIGLGAFPWGYYDLSVGNSSSYTEVASGSFGWSKEFTASYVRTSNSTNGKCKIYAYSAYGNNVTVTTSVDR